MYDFFLQLHLSNLNGMKMFTMTEKENDFVELEEKNKKKNVPVATVFFRMSHKNQGKPQTIE
jgi:hypothetical protein